MAVKIFEKHVGPNCYELEIRLSEEHERERFYSFGIFLGSVGLTVDKDFGGNARGYHMLTILVSPERREYAKNKINEWAKK